MLLDYYGYTLDDDLLAKFMPLLSGTLDFFGSHYGDVSKPGSKLTLFPTQGRIDGQYSIMLQEDLCRKYSSKLP